MFDSLSTSTLSAALAAARLLKGQCRSLSIDDMAPKLDTLTADIRAELDTRTKRRREKQAGPVTAQPGPRAVQTAELIAARLAGKPAWTPVDSDAALARQLDVSAFTVWNAKQVLASRGLIVKQKGSWYVQRPQDEAPQGDAPAPAGLTPSKA